MIISKDEVLEVIKKYQDEILEQTDWWYGFENHDINVFCYDDNPYLPDSVFQISVYTLGDRGVDNMYEEVENQIPSMTRLQIKLL